MKNLLFATTLFICTSIVYAQETNWKLHKSIDFGYRIEFPDDAISKVEVVPTDKGNVNMNTYTHTPETGNDVLIYMTSFTLYPDSFFPDGINTYEEEESILDGAVNGAVTNTRGKLMLDDKIKFNGFNGRLIKIEIPSPGANYIIKMKCFLVGLKLYLMQTISVSGKEDNKDSRQFFESFELINVKQ